MSVWDVSEIAPGLPIKSTHVRQASNDWQGDIDANGHDLTAVGDLDADSIETDALDVAGPATARDLTVYDDTPTTGVTSATVRAGAGQSSSGLLMFRDAGGDTMSQIGPQGDFGIYAVASGKLKMDLIESGIFLSSDLPLIFNSGDDLNSLSIDVAFGRSAAGELKISDGSGNPRNLVVRRSVQSVVPVSYSGTPTFDAETGSAFTITLTGDVSSSTLSGAKAGQTVTFKITQDGTGGRAFTWPTNVLGGMTIDSGAAAGEIATQQFHCFDGTNYEAISMGAIR